MDIAQTNRSLFKAHIPIENASIDEKDVSAPKSPNPYVGVLLCEYYSLLKYLSKLDEIQLQAIQTEVMNALDKLEAVLGHVSPSNAIDVFATLRHLKRKTNNLAATVVNAKSVSRRSKQTLSFSYTEKNTTET